jgi:hypothetical protein
MLLINSAFGVAPHDRELRAFVADRFAEIEAFFHRSIKAVGAEGEIHRDRAAKVFRRLLITNQRVAAGRSWCSNRARSVRIRRICRQSARISRMMRRLSAMNWNAIRRQGRTPPLVTDGSLRCRPAISHEDVVDHVEDTHA